MSASVCPQCNEPGQVHAPDTEPVRHCPSCLLPLVVVANKYKIEKTLTEGGCGVLYLSKHTKLQMDPIRVIKFIKPEICEEEKHIKRLAREVEVTAALSQRSQHIVRVFDDFDHIDGLGSYYVMEYLEGEDLSELIDRCLVLPYRKIFHIFRQLCEAMKDAHEANIIHRDLKPQNVFLTQRGDDDLFVKIIDFGIAKTLANPNQTKLTGGALGTPEYMSPEQCTGHEITARTDIYAMGIILYEMLVGHTPFLPVGESNPIPMKIVLSHLKDAPLPPSKMAMKPGRTQRQVPPELDAVVLKCLAKKPSERYQSASEILAAIEPIAKEFEETKTFSSLITNLDDGEENGNTTSQSGESALTPWSDSHTSGQQGLQIGAQEGGYSLGGPSKHTMDNSADDAPKPAPQPTKARPKDTPAEVRANSPQKKSSQSPALPKEQPAPQVTPAPTPEAEGAKPKAASVELTYEQPGGAGRIFAMIGLLAILIVGGWFGWKVMTPAGKAQTIPSKKDRRPAPRREPTRRVFAKQPIAPTRSEPRDVAPRPVSPRVHIAPKRPRRVVKRRRSRKRRRRVALHRPTPPRPPKPTKRPDNTAAPGCPPDQPGFHWVRATISPRTTRLHGNYKQIEYKGRYMCVRKPAGSPIVGVTFKAPGYARCIVLNIPNNRRKIRIKLQKQNDDISPKMGYCVH